MRLARAENISHTEELRENENARDSQRLHRISPEITLVRRCVSDRDLIIRDRHGSDLGARDANSVSLDGSIFRPPQAHSQFIVVGMRQQLSPRFASCRG